MGGAAFSRAPEKRVTLGYTHLHGWSKDCHHRSLPVRRQCYPPLSLGSWLNPLGLTTCQHLPWGVLSCCGFTWSRLCACHYSLCACMVPACHYTCGQSARSSVPLPRCRLRRAHYCTIMCMLVLSTRVTVSLEYAGPPGWPSWAFPALEKYAAYAAMGLPVRAPERHASAGHSSTQPTPVHVNYTNDVTRFFVNKE